jgi:hypothetical protein
MDISLIKSIHITFLVNSDTIFYSATNLQFTVCLGLHKYIYLMLNNPYFTLWSRISTNLVHILVASHLFLLLFRITLGLLVKALLVTALWLSILNRFGV